MDRIKVESVTSCNQKSLARMIERFLDGKTYVDCKYSSMMINKLSNLKGIDPIKEYTALIFYKD